jgi:enamine deaminase RidA (YjgF/YER057c/UK114 family)
VTFRFTAAASAADDVRSESALSFAAVAAALEAAGGRFEDIARTRLLYTSADDYQAMSAVRAPLFRERLADVGYPAASGFVTGGRGGGSPRFEIEVIAHPQRRTANSPAVVHRFGDVVPPFAHANEAGGIVFVSGQTAFNLDGTFPQRTATEQAEKVLGTLEPILSEFARSLSDLIGLTIFIAPSVSPADFVEVEGCVRRFLADCGARPVVTWLGIQALIFPGAVLGMEAVAGFHAAAVKAPDGNAARCGELIVASATAGGPVAQAVTQAADDLGRAIAQTGARPQRGGLVTAWFARGGREEVLKLVRDALGDLVPDPTISVAPMRAITSDETIMIELYAATA